MLRTAKKSGFSNFLEGIGEALSTMAEVAAEERRKEEARKQFMARSAGDIDQMRFELMQFKNELMKMQAQDAWRMTREEQLKFSEKKSEIQKMIRMYEQALASKPQETSPRLYEPRTDRLKDELFDLKKELAALNAKPVLLYGSEESKRYYELKDLIRLYEKELGK